MMLIIKFKKIYVYIYTYSVLSTVGVVGMIISIQLTKMVVIINSENKGCTRMYIATLLMGLNGFNIHRASVAENLKISLPLLMTTKVWNKNNTFVNTRYHLVMLCDFQLQLWSPKATKNK